MKITRLYIAAVMIPAITAITGCSDEIITIDRQSGEEQVPISLGAAYPTLSRASDAGFEEGDAMGVYVLDYTGDEPQAIDGVGIHAENVHFKFRSSDNSWTGVTDIYWKDNSTPADIIGYYPYTAEVANPTAFSHTISRRQDVTGSATETGGYEASDLLWAKAEKVMPTSARVNLIFRHLMAGVHVVLTEGTGFAAGEWENLEKKVLVTNVIQTSTVNLSTGDVIAGDGAPVSVTPYEYNGEWRAVVVPQTIAAGNIISLSVDGVSYNLVKNEGMTYQGGKLHNFTITVNKRTATGDYEFKLSDEAITAWIDDVDFRDGLMRRYINIEVTQRGSLADAIAAAGLEPSKISCLKLKGEINEDDFKYIRENIPYLSAINLYETQVYCESTAGTIPSGALEGMNTLNHVVFPGHLKKIAGGAFANTGLTGDLILPEGLTHISTNGNKEEDGYPGAFSGCSSLVGTLSLPSTLTFIGLGSFDSTALSGNLILPDGVTHIGPYAFSHTRFTGELILPKNLSKIEAGIFAGVPFTGSLEIPQGVKEIVSDGFGSFDGCNFSGTLILHEGLTMIGNNSFRGCSFKGELKLPESLRMIGENAFAGNKISSIVFPERLGYLGAGSFNGCDRLSGTLTIPGGISSIFHETFTGCTLLSEVILHEDVTKIEGGAFMNCHNLMSLKSQNPEPPLLTTYEPYWLSATWSAFEGVPKDNFTVEVPEKSINAYRTAPGWRDFRRIAAYSNFVCRPAKVCAINTRHEETIVLNADGPWKVTHQPSWVNLSKTSGDNKSEIRLTIDELTRDSGDRTDYIEFALEGTEFTTRCDVGQWDYVYGEDECITLQRATAGIRGIDILFVGEGFDAESIASGSYIELVNEQMDAFFGVEPYTSYRDYFNVYACVSLSQDTGINTDSRYVNTRFNALYTVGSLIIDNCDDVYDYAVAHSPLTQERMGQSLIIMSLNSNEYGSATSLTWNGSAIAMVSRSDDPYPMDSRGILQHEACGHAFGKLAEERISKSSYLTRSEKDEIMQQQAGGWYQNLSLTGNLAEVAWSDMIFDPRYSDKVDIYEGGYGVTRGVFRAEINSCMNYGIPYFSAPARRDIVKRILDYSGEGFTQEKFLAKDTDRWGGTGNSRAIGDVRGGGASYHHPVRIVKSKKY